MWTRHNKGEMNKSKLKRQWGQPLELDPALKVNVGKYGLIQKCYNYDNHAKKS